MNEEILYQKYNNQFQKYLDMYAIFIPLLICLGIIIYIFIDTANPLLESMPFAGSFIVLMFIIVFKQKNQISFVSTRDENLYVKTIWRNNIIIPLQEIKEFRNYIWSYGSSAKIIGNNPTAHVITILTLQTKYTATIHASHEEQYNKLVNFLKDKGIPQDDRNPLNQPLFFRRRKK